MIAGSGVERIGENTRHGHEVVDVDRCERARRGGELSLSANNSVSSRAHCAEINLEFDFQGAPAASNRAGHAEFA